MTLTPADAPRSKRRLRIVGLLLLALLGFALAASVRSQRTASQLATTRPSDLVRILDDLDARAALLRTQITDLQNTRSRLSGSGSDAAALAEARTRTQDLAILAGTIAAHGPGIELTITDPQHDVTAEVLVDTVEELRDAGAETLEVGGTRLGATSWIEDTNSGVSVDGHPARAPYLIRAIGDPPTMQKALEIPGGVVDTVDARAGAGATIKAVPDEQIRSLRVLPPTG
ncbi:MAG TPA: DUF881 domain-containing protein [Frankiaceae bacterium]|nr:DUF881 domain-containing protein [Frankiaceae bacterium]